MVMRRRKKGTYILLMSGHHVKDLRIGLVSTLFATLSLTESVSVKMLELPSQ